VGRDEERRTTARLGLHHDRDGRDAWLCPEALFCRGVFLGFGVS
jgi:hypothetical protein